MPRARDRHSRASSHRSQHLAESRPQADDRDRPLAVWIQPSAAIDDWMPGYVDRVREAFEEWGEVGIPLGFVFVDDSADAEVHVNWIRSEERRVGKECRSRW